jgi:adenylate cyclase
MSAEVQRKLTTILAADAAGYSREMQADEVRTLEALRAARAVFARFIVRHKGRIANTAGDGLIADFPSVVEAVQCAIEVQRELGEQRGVSVVTLRFRIGIHLGDVIVDGDDLLGEGVNLAARLQTMAEPGGILISRQVYDQVRGKLSVGFEYLGEKRPKNFAQDVAVYRISRGTADDWRTALLYPNSTNSGSPSGGRAITDPRALRARLIRQARTCAILFAALLVGDLTTGPGLWVQWPGLCMVLFLAYGAAPLGTHGRISLDHVRAGIIVSAFFLINLFTWNGTLWAVWPAAAVMVLTLIRRRSTKPR